MNHEKQSVILSLSKDQFSRAFAAGGTRTDPSTSLRSAQDDTRKNFEVGA